VLPEDTSAKRPSLRVDRASFGQTATRIALAGLQCVGIQRNEPAACKAVAPFGLNLVAAGSGLARLSAAYSRRDTERTGLCNQVEKALRLADAALRTSRQQTRPHHEIEYQTEFNYLGDMSLST
jgi:hypothetical protein